MLGIRQTRAGSGGKESSPLASQLQQAWLHSQISSPSPKFQKRGLATQVQDVSAERRAASNQQFHQVASDLSSIVADHAGFENAVNYEDLYFHKSRHKTPEFPKRPVFPQLVSYSSKADLPQRSRSGRFSESSSSLSSSGLISSQKSGSLSPACSSTSSDFRGHTFDDAGDAVDSGNKNALDLAAAQTEPIVRSIDGLTIDETFGEEMFTLPEDVDYQAMAKEFDDLVGPDNALKIRDSEEPVDAAYDNSWTTAGFLPTEEGVTDKFIHAYTCNLTKHVTDVSENVDASTWVNELDACTDHSDESWDWYLECIRAKSGGDRRNSTSSSSLHQQEFYFDTEISPESFSFTPGCVDLKGLLLRYVCCNSVVGRVI